MDLAARRRRAAGEVPDAEGECEQAEAVGQQRIATGVQPPALTEGDARGEQHDDGAKVADAAFSFWAGAADVCGP
ncbi:MAG TPA: hypothetical protein VMV57_06055 [Terracidiphilus sp.]|nr:hypothetical protein [Terracidiphilus sp.]